MAPKKRNDKVVSKIFPYLSVRQAGCQSKRDVANRSTGAGCNYTLVRIEIDDCAVHRFKSGKGVHSDMEAAPTKADCRDGGTNLYQTRIFGGAMSGTSADGIDVAFIKLTTCLHTPRTAAAACSTTERSDAAARADSTAKRSAPARHWEDVKCSLLYCGTAAYPQQLRERIFAIRQSPSVPLEELASLTRDISLAYSAALHAAAAASGVAFEDVVAIGVHGQTLFHAPPLTMQVISAPVVAARVGCDIVSDFRTADCAAGGQGAPLVPLVDYLLFKAAEGRVLVNLGGIANITVIPPNGAPAEVLAFDTGPANCISDYLMRTAGGGVACDMGGALAGTGTPIGAVVDAVLAAPFFTLLPPKSTDTPAMIAAFETAVTLVRSSTTTSKTTSNSSSSSNSSAFSLPDLLATACMVTSVALARGIHTGIRSATARCPRVKAEGMIQPGLGATVAEVEAVAVTAAHSHAHDDVCGSGRSTLHASMTTGSCSTRSRGANAEQRWQVYVSGGGVDNATLMRMLTEQLMGPMGACDSAEAGQTNIAAAGATASAVSTTPSTHSSGSSTGAPWLISSVSTTTSVSMPPAAKEAVAFAILAAATVDRVPGNLPSCTGARHCVVGGCVTPAPLAS